MIKTILALSIAGLMACAASGAAHAHDWYPAECCSGYDCFRANAITADGRGNRIVLIGDVRIEVPARLKPRPSPDAAIHVCYQSYPGELDGQPIFVPNCLFLPAHLM